MNKMLEDLAEVVRLGYRTGVSASRMSGAQMCFMHGIKREHADYYASTINLFQDHHATITDMAKRLDAAESDAARYRHLRKEGDIGCVINGVNWMTFDELDAAIDAAMHESGDRRTPESE